VDEEREMSFGVGAIVSAILHLKRVCPKCGREQIVPLSKKHAPVPCKFCGAEIPAKPAR